jgi:membrane protein required for colicin V production
MTLFDYAVLVITGFSVVLGVIRGLTREVIALGSWVVAVFMASVYGGEAAVMFAGQIANAGWRALTGFVTVFIVTLIVMSLIAMLVSRLIKSAGLGAEDRVLGGFFGFARGLLVVMVLVLLAGLTGLPRQAVWKDAMLAAPLEQLAVIVKEWLPQGWAKYISYS